MSFCYLLTSVSIFTLRVKNNGTQEIVDLGKLVTEWNDEKNIFM